MARIRSIKPEFWSDHRLAATLTRDQRLFYIGLWNEADDDGRFQAHPRRLLGVVFPYDRDLTEQFIEDSLRTLAQAGKLVRYTVEGEPYAQLTKFRDHQKINRPTPSRIPSPDSELATPSVNAHGGLNEGSQPDLLLGSVVGAGKGKGEENASAAPPRSPKSGVKPKPEAKRWTVVPDSWTGPNESARRYAAKHHIDLDAIELLFRSHEYAPNKAKTDPDRAFMTFLVNEKKWAKERQGNRPSPGSEASGIHEERPQSPAPRSGADELDVRAKQEEERVKAWTHQNPEAAQALWQDVLDGLSAFGSNLKQDTQERIAKGEFRKRVLERAA